MKLFKAQVKKPGKDWQDMSYSPRTEDEGNAIVNHYQSHFPQFEFRLREYK